MFVSRCEPHEPISATEDSTQTVELYFLTGATSG
jgi:hypothetical protein